MLTPCLRSKRFAAMYSLRMTVKPVASALLSGHHLGAVAIGGCMYLFWSLPSTTQLYFLIWNALAYLLSKWTIAYFYAFIAWICDVTTR